MPCLPCLYIPGNELYLTAVWGETAQPLHLWPTCETKAYSPLGQHHPILDFRSPRASDKLVLYGIASLSSMLHRAHIWYIYIYTLRVTRRIFLPVAARLRVTNKRATFHCNLGDFPPPFQFGGLRNVKFLWGSLQLIAPIHLQRVTLLPCSPLSMLFPLPHLSLEDTAAL